MRQLLRQTEATLKNSSKHAKRKCEASEVSRNDKGRRHTIYGQAGIKRCLVDNKTFCYHRGNARLRPF